MHTSEERQKSAGEGSESSSPEPDSNSKTQATMQTCAAQFETPQSCFFACDLENQFRSEVVKFSHANLYELHQALRGFGFRMFRADLRAARMAGTNQTGGHWGMSQVSSLAA